MDGDKCSLAENGLCMFDGPSCKHLNKNRLGECASSVEFIDSSLQFLGIIYDPG